MRDTGRGAKDGGNKDVSPLKGGRGWILIAGTLFHFEKIEAPTTVTVAHALAAARVCQAVSLS